MKSILGILALAALTALAACDAAGAERTKSVDACRAAIASHLVDPPSARFETISVSERGEGRGWLIAVDVSATDGAGARHRDRVRCQVDGAHQVVDLSD